MNGSDGTTGFSRRALLRATSGTVALSTTGAVQARGSDGARERPAGRCPEATVRPSTDHCEGASIEGCAGDHPVTVALREDVRKTLDSRYPDAGTLVEAGFKPYFDTLDGDDDGWSHWLHPEYIGDDAVLDPERPEAVLVDNRSWRSIGVMFVATRDGEPVDSPPAVYDVDGDREYPDDGDDSDRDHEDGDLDRCAPWHYHAGLPGRFAWWYYKRVYEEDSRDDDLQLPCRTPCLMHVWTADHPEGVYAHDAPPTAYRDREPAEDPGFDDAEPGEDELGWDALPDEVVPDRKPDEFSIPGRPEP